jgi:magnesium chelatase family protein
LDVRRVECAEFRRSSGHWCFPAKFGLVGAMTACPCGYLGHPERACTCSQRIAERYTQRVPTGLFDETVQVAPAPRPAAQEGRPAPA